MRDEYQKNSFREVQGARISRFLRDSEVGWLFYGPGGDAFHVLSEEAEQLEAEGNALVERCLAGGFMPMRLGRGRLLALVLLALAASIVLPPATQHLLIPAFMVTGIVLFAAVAIGNDVAYELALRRWRRGHADRLRRLGRGGVPKAVAAKHRRHNLFLYGCIGAALLYLLRVSLMMAGIIDTPAGGFAFVDIAIIAVIVLCTFPATMVDRTHRRRKWLD